jgi:uncharacterized protein
MSYKENKLLYKIASKLGKKFVVLRFDFSGCVGESQGLCEDMMISHQIEDLLSAINYLQQQDFVSSIGLVGHSLGGLTSIIVAAKDPRINAIVSIAAPANLALQTLINDEMAKMWKHDGKYVFKSRKGPVKVDYTFYKEMNEYNAENIIKSLKVPILIIHGNKDSIVSAKSSELLFTNAQGYKDLKILDSDHMFLDTESTEKVNNLVMDWFEKYLK